MERTFKNELSRKLSGLYPLRGTLCYPLSRRLAVQLRMIEWISIQNPCDFASFQTTIKFLSFTVEAWISHSS